jgi:hypothetical protein
MRRLRSLGGMKGLSFCSVLAHKKSKIKKNYSPHADGWPNWYLNPIIVGTICCVL